MKQLLTLVTLLLLMASGVSHAELKIAVLNAQGAIMQTDQAKAIMDAFNKEIADERQEVEDLRNDLLKLQEKVRQDGEVMSDEEKRRIAKEAEDKRMDYDFKSQKLSKEIQDKVQDVLGQMSSKLDAVVQDLIQVEGYDMVVPRQNVFWVNPKHDITRRVTEKLNERE